MSRMPAKVSVLMTTYNQDQYIRQGIESVLAQQASFAYELVIGEDCSTDGTRAICRAYQQQHPETIRLLAREKNLGAAENFLSALAECSGEYLAILDGDDFWPNPLKLQEQADCLDANPGHALVFARTEAFFQDGDRPSYEIPSPNQERYTLETLLRSNYIATCSVMYRKGVVKEYPSWLSQLDMGDWPLHVLYAQHGSIGYIDETMAAYRIHSSSTFSSRSVADNYKSILTFYRCIGPHLGPQHEKAISLHEARICKAVVRPTLVDRHWLEAVRYAWLALLYYIRFKLK